MPQKVLFSHFGFSQVVVSPELVQEVSKLLHRSCWLSDRLLVIVFAIVIDSRIIPIVNRVSQYIRYYQWDQHSRCGCTQQQFPRKSCQVPHQHCCQPPDQRKSNLLTGKSRVTFRNQFSDPIWALYRWQWRSSWFGRDLNCLLSLVHHCFELLVLVPLLHHRHLNHNLTSQKMVHWHWHAFDCC